MPPKPLDTDQDADANIAVLERRRTDLKDRGASNLEVTVVTDKRVGTIGADWIDGDGNELFSAVLADLLGRDANANSAASPCSNNLVERRL